MGVSPGRRTSLRAFRRSATSWSQMLNRSASSAAFLPRRSGSVAIQRKSNPAMNASKRISRIISGIFIDTLAALSMLSSGFTGSPVLSGSGETDSCASGVGCTDESGPGVTVGSAGLSEGEAASGCPAFSPSFSFWFPFAEALRGVASKVTQPKPLK